MEVAYRAELINISKSFGGITALKNVNFNLKQGEIHALAGENGAGKSTLMKILSGACMKDAGKIIIDNSEAIIRNTHDSKKLGIGIIYQEFSLVPDLSVTENIFLSRLRIDSRWIQWKRLRQDAAGLIESLGFRIDTSIKVRKLSVAHQQVVEIAKALSEKVKILILDEPSAALGPADIRKLFETLARLKRENVSLIYITHNLDEIFELADRVTVLKDGTSGPGIDVSETDKDKLIEQMLGRTLGTMFPERNARIGEETLRAEHIKFSDKVVQGVDLKINRGEILGIAGLVGSGRTETVRAIFGADKRNDGVIFLKGKKCYITSPVQSVRQGLGMVPEDRKRDGLILSLPVGENISLPGLSGISGRWGFIRQKKEKRANLELISGLSIKVADPAMKASTLSGGNQQKVVLARWMNRNCEVLIIDEPTRGVDVGAKAEIYKLINELSERGTAILVVSSDTEELIGLCDRIMVMFKGQVRGEIVRKDFSEEKILKLALGEN